jgi:chloramphenicol-sensitive protein RarD
LPHVPRVVTERRRGIAYALTAYGLWGLMPLYVKTLGRLPLLQIVAHRIVWAAVLLVAVVLGTGQRAWLRQLKEQPRIARTFAFSAAALSVNWLVYIWAVGQGRVVDASLGYFINPLLSVVLAVVVLKERLRVGQWLAVAVAALGVLWLGVLAGQVPWIGLTVAVSFGVYGLLRKTAAIDALGGLTLETLLLLPLALGYLVYLSFQPGGAFGAGGLDRVLLLLAAGPVTAVPLLAFAAGARRIPLSLLGILQYVAPSLQLGIGLVVFKEPLPTSKLIGFALIWLAVLVYSIDGVRQRSLARS